MRKIILLIIAFVFLIKPFAQKVNTDSLEKVLNSNISNEEELKIIKILAEEFVPISAEKTLKYANKGIAISEKSGNEADKSEFLLDIGNAYSYANEFEKADKFLKQSLAIRLKSKNVESVAIAYSGIADNFYYQNNFDSAIVYCKKVHEITQKSELFELQAKAYYLEAQVKRKLNKNEEAYSNLEKAVQFYEKTTNKSSYAKALNSLGQLSQELGNYDKSIEFYNMALQIHKSLKQDNSCAIINYNIGNVYYSKGSYNEAMQSFQEALSFFDKAGKMDGVASCYNNIGLVYEKLPRNDNFSQNQYYYSNALKYHKMAYELRKKTGNENELASSLINMANIYYKYSIDSLINIYGSAWEDSLNKNRIYSLLTRPLNLYESALKIKTKYNDESNIATCLINLGNIYYRSGKYLQSLQYLTKSININKELGNKSALSFSYYQISRMHLNLNHLDKATLFIDEGTNLSREISDNYMLKEFFKLRSEYFDKVGDYKNSLKYYKMFQELQDSIINNKNVKQIEEINTKFETEKKDNEIKLQNSRIKQQRLTIYGVGLVLLLIIGISLLLIKQNRERKRVNNELEKKNHVITEQKKEITDSIQYASLIQTAAMPSYEIVKKHFAGSFIFFKPRDIVSGDFYWLKEINGSAIIAAADCTGHGVPGAFMSMLGISTLNNIVSSIDEIHSDTILNELRRLIIYSLNQTGKSGENKDGMDLALYVFNPEASEIEYSGANNSLVLIRKGEIIEYKADKMPIGIHDRANEPFTRHTFKVEKNDMIYTFSDGYADQFGGEENKKFMSGKMKKMFAAIAEEPIEKQYDIIDKTNSGWRGENFQTDDMLIIGIRI